MEVIEAEGKPFDPNIHEAVTTQPAPAGVAEGTVLADLRRGYMLHGKLLRPTMVTVAAPIMQHATTCFIKRVVSDETR